MNKGEGYMKFTKYIILFLISLFFTDCKKQEKIIITGSETMHSMILLISNNFMKENKNYSIDVRGGGSGEGINELINGITDIALSSRDLTESEFEKLNHKQTLESIVVAYDGAAFVVHPMNPVEKLTLEQASDIFTGKINNWKQLDGLDKPIKVVIRDNYSGTAHYIKEHVVRQLDLGQSHYFKINKMIIRKMLLC